MPISLKRIFRFGWEKFTRDRTSTIGALVVMVIAISIITGTFLLQGISDFIVVSLQESVDVSAYFVDNIAEDEILQARAEILQLPEVKSVEYISKEQALRAFLLTHENDEVVLQSLDAVGSNPLLASLNIIAHDSSQYGSIVRFLHDSSFASIISDVDYFDRIPVIERIASVTNGIQKGVLVLGIITALVAVLVAFNTIRLTIYNSKEEIEVMRLVGTSNWFIRGPFLVLGIIVGVAASLISLILFYGVVLFMSSRISDFVPGFSLSAYFVDNIVLIILLQLGVGIGLGVASAMIAIRQYLKI